MIQRQDEMGAGSVLRIALAEALMGGFCAQAVEIVDVPGVFFFRAGPRVLRGETGGEPVAGGRYVVSWAEWEPDTDRVDAFDVVDRMRELGYQFTLADINRKRYAAFIKGHHRFDGIDDRADALAICRAAFKAAQQHWRDQQAGREARYARA